MAVRIRSLSIRGDMADTQKRAVTRDTLAKRGRSLRNVVLIVRKKFVIYHCVRILRVWIVSWKISRHGEWKKVFEQKKHMFPSNLMRSANNPGQLCESFHAERMLEKLKKLLRQRRRVRMTNLPPKSTKIWCCHQPKPLPERVTDDHFWLKHETMWRVLHSRQVTPVQIPSHSWSNVMTKNRLGCIV